MYLPYVLVMLWCCHLVAEQENIQLIVCQNHKLMSISIIKVFSFNSLFCDSFFHIHVGNTLKHGLAWSLGGKPIFLEKSLCAGYSKPCGGRLRKFRRAARMSVWSRVDLTSHSAIPLDLG